MSKVELLTGTSTEALSVLKKVVSKFKNIISHFEIKPSKLERTPLDDTFVKENYNLSKEFKLKFDKCHSTQDLEKLIERSTSVDECNYLAKELSKPHIINEDAVHEIAAKAKTKATKLSLQAKYNLSKEFKLKFDKCHSTQDLEKLIERSTSVDECNYLAKELSKPHIINEDAVHEIAAKALDKATQLAVQSR